MNNVTLINDTSFIFAKEKVWTINTQGEKKKSVEIALDQIKLLHRLLECTTICKVSDNERSDEIHREWFWKIDLIPIDGIECPQW